MCALHAGHGASGFGTSIRYKDLVDLLLIAVKSTLPGESRTGRSPGSQRRRNAGTPVRFPDRFAVPADDWARVPIGLRTLDGAFVLADALITPLLQPTPPGGVWCPDERTWR
jgi:hypothetical protein